MTNRANKLPTISVIVAVFNGAKTLQRCIDGIASQTYPHKELIIMDGASKDATVSILERNTSKISYWESKVDRGIAHAWNKALEHSSGDWIIFLGADDRFRDEHVLADMAKLLSNDRESDLVYGQLVFEGGENHGLVLGGPIDLSVLKRRMVIPHTATFQRRTLFDEVGKFDEVYKIAIDYEIVLRKKNISARFVNRLVCVMGGEGMSSRLIKKTLQESRMAQIKNRVASRLKIEAWHTFFQLRYWINSRRSK